MVEGTRLLESPRSFLLREWQENGWFSRILPVCTCVACLAVTFLFDTTGSLNNTNIIVIGLCAIVAVFVWSFVTGHKLTTKQIVLLLFFAGFLLRLDYTLYTDVSLTSMVRQHDVGRFGQHGIKHAGYIEWFYYNGFKLQPDPTIGQFYHPPLHHFLTAAWLRLLTFCGFSFDRAVTSIQYLTLFYSCCCTLVIERILSLFELDGYGKVAAFALVAFHPTFILLAGSINNDVLALLFTLLAAYATLRWYQSFSMSGIAWIALSIGLGMMTKLTVAVLAPPIALLFLIKIVQVKGERLKCLAQFVVFGCISFPLGLWFPVWKLVRYGVPLTYVQKLSVKSSQYIGDYTFKERLFDYSQNFFATPFDGFLSHELSYQEYNPLVATVKTSVFGEYNLALVSRNVHFTCRMLLMVNILLILVSLVAMLGLLIRIRKTCKPIPLFFLMIYHVVLFAYFIKFCFDFPHTCSMDYRYIVPTCVMGALYIGMRLNEIEDHSSHTYSVLAQGVAGTLVAEFCILSSFLYVMLGLY